MRKYTREEIEKHLTPAGGYLRKDIESMGVTWPPMKGWKERLMKGEEPNHGAALLPRPKDAARGPTRGELVALIAKQQAEIDRLRLELDEATLRAAWLDRID